MRKSAIAVLVVCLLMVSVSGVVAQEQADYREIGAEEMEELYDQSSEFKLLDVQTMQEHIDYGFPPKSMCIPLKLQDEVTKEWSENPDFISQVESRLAKDETIVILCSSGTRSKTAAAMMSAAGFTDVLVYRYGIHGLETKDGKFHPGWIETSLPFVRGTLN